MQKLIDLTINKPPKTHWTWYYAFVLVLTMLDYLNHISQANSDFALDKTGWALFSLAAAIALCLVTGLTHRILSHMPMPRLTMLYEGLAVLSGVLFHVYIGGPVFNQLFFSQTPLAFSFNWLVAGGLLGMYYLIRFASKPETS